VDVIASGQLVRLHVCASCGAVVADLELHRRWHEEQVG
jgi:hypothetical protein